MIDSAHWAGDLGDEIKETFLAPIKGLPQDEPLFSVSKVNPLKLNSTLKSARNMIFVMTLDKRSEQSRSLRGYFTNDALKKIQRDTSLFYTVHQDEFAKGQSVMYLFGKNEELLMNKIEKNRGRLREFFETLARKRIKSEIFKSRNREAEKSLAETVGVKMQVPFGWDVSKNVKNFAWLRFIEADKEKNIFIYHEPYRSEDVFQNIPALRDKITEQFLRDSQKPELFITRQTRSDLVTYFEEPVNFKGNYASKSRGLWMVSDKSAGGPFISYAMVDEKSQRLYYIEGYVYFPKSTKKTLIREVDAILSSVEF